MILVADDRPIIRRGLLLIIAEAGDLKAEEVAGADELFDRLRSSHVELLLLSTSFARDDVEMLPRIKAGFQSLHVLVFDWHSDDLAAMRALRAGASGYIESDASSEELLAAIRRVKTGGTYLSQDIAEKIAAELARGGDGEKLHERLSRRELEVFRLLGAGRAVGEIARKLKISVKTVSTHRTRILEKTGMRNNAEIIRYAILNDLLA